MPKLIDEKKLERLNSQFTLTPESLLDCLVDPQEETKEPYCLRCGLDKHLWDPLCSAYGATYEGHKSSQKQTNCDCCLGQENCVCDHTIEPTGPEVKKDRLAEIRRATEEDLLPTKEVDDRHYLLSLIDTQREALEKIAQASYKRSLEWKLYSRNQLLWGKIAETARQALDMGKEDENVPVSKEHGQSLPVSLEEEKCNCEPSFGGIKHPGYLIHSKDCSSNISTPPDDNETYPGLENASCTCTDCYKPTTCHHVGPTIDANTGDAVHCQNCKGKIEGPGETVERVLREKSDSIMGEVNRQQRKMMHTDECWGNQSRGGDCICLIDTANKPSFWERYNEQLVKSDMTTEDWLKRELKLLLQWLRITEPKLTEDCNHLVWELNRRLDEVEKALEL